MQPALTESVVHDESSFYTGKKKKWNIKWLFLIQDSNNNYANVNLFLIINIFYLAF